jgi:hypothetical protein
MYYKKTVSVRLYRDKGRSFLEYTDMHGDIYTFQTTLTHISMYSDDVYYHIHHKHRILVWHYTIPPYNFILFLMSLVVFVMIFQVHQYPFKK